MDLTALREWTGWILVVGGVALTLLSAVGLHRFGSVLARMQVAGKATTLGVMLVLVGSALAAPSVGDALVLLLAAALLVVTAPVGFNALGQAARGAMSRADAAPTDQRSDPASRDAR